MDLREELGKAIDGETDAPAEPAADVASPAVEPVEAAPEAPAEPAEGNGDGRVRGADGRFLPKSEKPVTQEAQPSTPASPQAAPAAAPSTEQVPQGVDLPPSTWTATAKAEYAKLPEVIRTEIKKRESDFQKGITQYKTAADFGSRIDQVMRPYEAIIRSKGGNPEGVIGNLLDTAYKLQTGTPQQKAQLLLQAAQQYGADMSVFGGRPAEGVVDQSSIAQQVQQLLQPHLQKIDQFSTQFTSAQQQREQQEQQTLASQIDAFRTATDEKGQPKHVYFENVRGTMAALIDSGDAKTLDAAYEMACRAHPEVSKIVGAEQRQRDEAQRLAEARRLADEARRANTVNAQGQGGVGIADTSKVSLRDELDARLEGRIA